MTDTLNEARDKFVEVHKKREYAVIFEALTKDLHAAKGRHAEAVATAEAEEINITNLRQSLAAIGQLCGKVFEEEDEYGLTDLVRMALKTLSGGALAPPEVKTRIESLGYPQKSENTLASIHTILKRLLAKGEVDTVIVQGNKTAYRWIGK